MIRNNTEPEQYFGSEKKKKSPRTSMYPLFILLIPFIHIPQPSCFEVTVLNTEHAAPLQNFYTETLKSL